MTILPIRALQDNYIWLLYDNSHRAVIVDPGEATPVMEALERFNLTLSAILITHHHKDHSGGLADLLRGETSPVQVIGTIGSRVTLINQHVSEGDHFTCASFNFNVLDTRGHTLDHVSYYQEKTGSLFCGDTLFSVGCGRIFEGTAPMMYASLQKIAQLPDETKIYCGHEYTLANLAFAEQVEPTNPAIAKRKQEVLHLLHMKQASLPSILITEKATNPFLRCHLPSVKQAVAKESGSAIDDPIQVFAYLREWKNRFIA